ncbi:MAG TPA: hypothetical protein VK099_06290 [Alcanivoracaceae bacterium]|nr:hypothetical protein [Alcanivoracaceae bacterium]
MAIKNKARIGVFWFVLIAFFVWDWQHSKPVNLRLEPPIIAIGSGQAPSGGHCASFAK